MSIETGLLGALWPTPGRSPEPAPDSGFCPLVLRDLDHGLAGGDLFIVLVAHHAVDQTPGRVQGGLFRFDQAAGLEGVARPDRLKPAGLEAAVDRARRIGPVGDHPRDQPEIVHAVHDNAAEIGLAEIAFHVIVVEMQWVVVERGVAEQADGFAADREFRALDGVAGGKTFERRCHDFTSLAHHCGRMVQPRPEQITSPCWLKNTLSCTTNSRSRLMNLSSARACSVMTSSGRAGIW